MGQFQHRWRVCLESCARYLRCADEKESGHAPRGKRQTLWHFETNRSAHEGRKSRSRRQRIRPWAEGLILEAFRRPPHFNHCPPTFAHFASFVVPFYRGFQVKRKSCGTSENPTFIQSECARCDRAHRVLPDG